MDGVYWISWENHRRTRELCSVLGVEFVLISSRYGKGLSHMLNIMATIRYISGNVPKVLVVQNPSIFLAFTAVVLKPIFKYYLVVDRHTNFRLSKKNGLNIYYYLFDLMSYISLKYSDITIVTNDYLSDLVRTKGGNPFVLPDRLPSMEGASSTIEDSGKNKIVFICTYANDEPYFNVINAGKLLDKNTMIYITGNYQGKILPDAINENIVLTGFLSQQEYDRLLHEADVILDFTELEWCLVCGGYEAIALCKPFITSDTKALRQLYGDAARYTHHDADSIAEAIRSAIHNKTEMIDLSTRFKKRYEKEWNEQFLKLQEMILIAEGGTGVT